MDAAHVRQPSSDGPVPAQAGRAPEAPLPRFAVVDIETSGLSTRWHRILQVAVVTVDHGEIVDEWVSLVRKRWPLQRIGPRRVHGITRTALRGAPRQRDVLTELSQRLDGAVFAAHNVRFDWPFLTKAARRSRVTLSPVSRLCTLRMSRALDPARERSHRLGDLCDRYDIVNDRPHDALHDARATAAALVRLLDDHGVESAADLERLYEFDR